MGRRAVFYIVGLILLGINLFFLNKAYKALATYSELTYRHSVVSSNYQILSRKVNNAALLNPDFVRASRSPELDSLFFTDSLAAIRQLNLVKTSVQDSVNIDIAEKLDKLIRPELSWFLNSNVPDAILNNNPPAHIATFNRIDSLITKGIQRTNFLMAQAMVQLNAEIKKAGILIILFFTLSGMLLIYTTVNFFQQKAKTNKKEKELETVFNRINDSVVSVDNNWRYSFLNDIALSTHPLGKENTLGKVIWDVHPEMKGTIFWDKYHEAMQTRKVVEIEDYYAPMDIWFSVKVYPSSDGLTIFYKNLTDSKSAEQKLSETLQEINDYKFALDEASIVAITDHKGIIRHANDNFCKISKYRREELIGQDHRIINSAYHSKEFIKNLWVTIANGKIWKGELKNKAKDNAVYWVDTTIVPFLNKEGKPYQYVAIRADITERKQVEENLQKSLKETADYKYALEESSIVAITDQKGIIKYANENFCKISKYAVDELIGQDHRIINSGYHPKEFIKDLWTTIANGKIWKGELKNRAKDGTVYWVDTTIVPFLNNEGKPYQYVAIRADITERKQAEENLQRSLKETADYKYALDESSIVAITDQKGIIKYANENFCKISKYAANELIGQDHRIINSGYHTKDFIRNLWATIANGKIWKGELKNKAKDGTIYWVDTTIIPFLDNEGKPYQYVAIRADITERKKAEENLLQSLKEITDYKFALDESSIVAITDQKGTIRHVNGNFCKISKFTASELVGHDHRLINSGYHSKEFIKNLWVTIANGKIWKGQLKNKAKDGTIYWVDTTIVPFLDRNDKPYQYVAIRADITERKDAEEKLIKSEKIYKTIASSIPGSVICLLDADYRYLLIEGDMLKKLGYSKDTLLGNKAQDVLAPEVFRDVQQDFKNAFEGKTITRESNTGGFDIISRFIPLIDENKNVYAIMTAAIDITQLKNAQRDLSELNRDLEERIKLRTEQLKKSNEELEAFSYSVSHDLRAPLRGIIAFAKILEEEYGSKLDAEAQRITSIVRENTLKMGTLIDDLLAFSRLGKQGLIKVKVNTDLMVREIVKEERVNKQGHLIIWDIQQLPPVHADTNTLRQVWINLISNAIKYSRNIEQPHIEIGSYRDKGNKLSICRRTSNNERIVQDRAVAFKR